LEERGFIRRLAHRARALEIVKLPESMERAGFKPKVIQGDKVSPPAAAIAIEAVYATELPVMGRIAAGVPIEAISHVSHHVAVPGSMLSANAQHYALEVKGDSMIDAGINDGDIVIIREQSTAENGEIVVALVEDAEATLKRFRRRGNMIALEAANPAYETRMIPDHMVKVQGRLVGLIRSY
jgi:repressor LexA